MKIKVTIAIAVLSVVLLGIVAVSLVLMVLVDPGVLDEQYSTYADLPAHRPPIPLSAREIRWKAIADTDQEWLTFDYDARQTIVMGDSCTQVLAADVEFPHRGSRRFGLGVDRMPWWPAELLDDSPRPNLDYIFYRCKHEKPFPAYPGVPVSYLALRPNVGKGFWWMNGD